MFLHTEYIQSRNHEGSYLRFDAPLVGLIYNLCIRRTDNTALREQRVFSDAWRWRPHASGLHQLGHGQRGPWLAEDITKIFAPNLMPWRWEFNTAILKPLRSTQVNHGKVNSLIGPVLNPIENLWNDLKSAVHRRSSLDIVQERVGWNCTIQVSKVDRLSQKDSNKRLYYKKKGLVESMIWEACTLSLSTQHNQVWKTTKMELYNPFLWCVSMAELHKSNIWINPWVSTATLITAGFSVTSHEC